MNIENTIKNKLLSAFKPQFLDVLNESRMHAVPKNSETHFKVIIVSAQFQDKTKVERHRMIYQCLSDELKSGVHALAIHPFTPLEWQKTAQKDLSSPPCSG